MRDAFFRTLLALAEDDERINLVVGDVGFGVVEPFAERYPRQFLNVGVAEQNMTGVATGMALAGKIVFTYSIANFPVLRCFEQIRNDVCYHDAPVKIVSVGGGLSYGALGISHHAVEDLAVMRVLPRMTVVAPGDPVETELATRAVAEHPGPCYLRLGRAGEPIVHKTLPTFELGKSITMRNGSDLTLVSTGALLGTVAAVATRLESQGVSVRHLSMHTLSPLDRKALLRSADETRAIVTLEEHSIVGGLGSAVAEVLAEQASSAAFLRVGLPPEFCAGVGSQQYLRNAAGLSESGIIKRLEPILKTIGVEGIE